MDQVAQLQDLLRSSFSRDEFRALFTVMGLEYEDAPSEAKQVLADHLVKSCQRQDRLDELIEGCA